MTLGMVAFWGLVIYAVVALVRGARSSPPRSEPGESAESPLQVLKRRLAAGELTVEEYEALRAVIDDIRPHAPPEPAVR
jgi:putative membrane protein